MADVGGAGGGVGGVGGDVEVVVGAWVDVVDDEVELLEVDVEVVVGASVEELEDVLDVVEVELEVELDVELVVGTVVGVGADVDVVVGGGAEVDVLELDDEVLELVVLELVLLVGDAMDVVVVVLVDVVVVPKFAAKPRIWRIVLPASVFGSNVVTKRSSLVMGSISMPIGGLANPDAKPASTGERAEPKGRPVDGSMSIRLIMLPPTLV